jgi:hypothetical protein
MSLTDLIPEPYRLAAEAALLAAALVAAGSCGWMVKGWKDDKQIAAMNLAHAQELAAQAKAVADQKDRNLDLQRQAELGYTVQADTRTEFITIAAKETHDAAAPLAACPVPDAVRVRLNAAVACARGDSTAACGAGQPVPSAR